MHEMEKLSEQKIKEGLYTLLSELFRVLSSPIRMKMLYMLYANGKRPTLTFSEIMFQIRKNPSNVKHHLDKLMRHKLVERTKDGYRITDIGIFALKAEVTKLIEITEKAIEKGKAEGYVVP